MIYWLQDHMPALLIVVVAVSAVVAAGLFILGEGFEGWIGVGGLDVPDRVPGPAPDAEVAEAQRLEEVRQLHAAVAAHRAARAQRTEGRLLAHRRFKRARGIRRDRSGHRASRAGHGR